jgi:hypothetical protein
MLHVLEVADDECRRRVHVRSVDRPAGLYFGHVTDEVIEAVLPRIVPPSEAEGFTIRRA